MGAAASKAGGRKPTKKDEGDEAKPPDRDLALETLALVMRGDILVEWHCYQADDMLAALEIAGEFGFKVRAFHHALEAYKIRDVLVAHGVGDRHAGTTGGASRWRRTTASPRTSRLMTEAGGRAAMHSDSPIAVQILNQAAGKALAAGRAAGVKIDENDALRWLTANPAWELGIDDQVGTLQSGKRADVVVWSEDPLQHVREGRARVHRRPARLRSGARRSALERLRARRARHARPRGGALMPAPIATRVRGAVLAASLGALCAVWTGPARAEEGPPLAITHALVYVPGGHPPVPDATVVLAGGKVQAVGTDVAPPPGARVLDAHGKTVTAGFIDADTEVGVVEVDLEPGANDDAAGGLLMPALRIVDGYNPRSSVIPITRAGGVTSVVVAPHGGALAGQSAFVDLAGDTQADAVVRPVARRSTRAPTRARRAPWAARSELWLVLRQALDDARFYATHRAQYDANGSRPLGLRRMDLEALLPVLRGEQPLVVTVASGERHRDGPALRRRVQAQARPVGRERGLAHARRDRARPRSRSSSTRSRTSRRASIACRARSDNAAILAGAGVSVVISTFSSHQARLLWQRAGNAVRLGMDHDAAIRAVTEAPADAFGLKGYGRLEAGRGRQRRRVERRPAADRHPRRARVRAGPGAVARDAADPPPQPVSLGALRARRVTLTPVP